ncbi:MAG: hypothetical protein HN576_05940 [Bacteriovoracaceae bacterium]|jgi:hypothetical protein|nr:hypothetical protein [Bacteriovoracaceae bacterium]
MAIQLREINLNKSSDVKEFAFLPWQIYKEDSTWVPPLKLALIDLLSPKHPFYETAEVKCWIAEENTNAVGRVMAVVNKKYNEYNNAQLGFFGFFECVEKQEVAKALLQKAESFLKDKGMTAIQGPVNPSTNYECGLLINGYDDSPQIMMTYNPKYYLQFLEDQNYTKNKDLIAYQFEIAKGMPPKIKRIAEMVRKRGKVKFRQIDLKNWNRDIAILQDIYNEAWEANWGFVPMTPEEFAHTAKDMKSIVDPNLLIIAEVDGEAAGFILTLPDYNQVFKKIPNGKLLPTGIFKLLFGKKKITRTRTITLGVKSKFRKYGLETVLYDQCCNNIHAAGYVETEMSWILEDNLLMNKPLLAMGAKPYKTYRIYGKELN